MPGRAGSRTPEAPRSGARGNRFCRALMINRRAQARSLRAAKLGGPRILGPARPAMVRSKSERDGSLETRRTAALLGSLAARVNFRIGPKAAALSNLSESLLTVAMGQQLT